MGKGGGKSSARGGGGGTVGSRSSAPTENQIDRMGFKRDSDGDYVLSVGGEIGGAVIQESYYGGYTASHFTGTESNPGTITSIGSFDSLNEAKAASKEYLRGKRRGLD